MVSVKEGMAMQQITYFAVNSLQARFAILECKKSKTVVKT
mgnify:CR=1 FL=1